MTVQEAIEQLQKLVDEDSSVGDLKFTYIDVYECEYVTVDEIEPDKENDSVVCKGD